MQGPYSNLWEPFVTTSVFRNPRARWAVPLGVLAVTASTVALVPVVAGASGGLQPRTAAELLAGLADASGQPFAGTVVTTARLGLPALPSVGSGSTSLQSLSSGSHTVRVWYASPTAFRAAVVDPLSETDVIRNGSDMWLWSSDSRTAQHGRLSASAERVPAMPTPASLTPSQLAEQALAAVDPTTAVSVDGSASVAGRDVYELVLRPRSADSLVGQVRLSVDAKTSIPLRVQLFARGAGTAAFDTQFTKVAFSTPDASLFRFVARPGSTVKELVAAAPAAARGTGVTPGAPKAEPGASPRVVGTGWARVVVASGVTTAGSSDPTLTTLLRSAKPVSGPGWSGRMLSTPLLTAVLTDDGRLAVGAVTPAAVQRALSAPATS